MKHQPMRTFLRAIFVFIISMMLSSAFAYYEPQHGNEHLILSKETKDLPLLVRVLGENFYVHPQFKKVAPDIAMMNELSYDIANYFYLDQLELKGAVKDYFREQTEKSYNEKLSLLAPHWTIETYNGSTGTKKLISDIPGFVAYNGKENILAIIFHGSRTVEDWSVNGQTGQATEVELSFLLNGIKSLDIHAGFVRRYARNRDSLLQAIENIINEHSYLKDPADKRRQQLKIIVSGHSLGAAQAQIALLDLALNWGPKFFGANFKNPIDNRLWGWFLSSPRISKKAETFRYINSRIGENNMIRHNVNGDPVTLAKPRSAGFKGTGRGTTMLMAGLSLTLATLENNKDLDLGYLALQGASLTRLVFLENHARKMDAMPGALKASFFDYFIVDPNAYIHFGSYLKGHGGYFDYRLIDFSFEALLTKGIRHEKMKLQSPKTLVNFTSEKIFSHLYKIDFEEHIEILQIFFDKTKKLRAVAISFLEYIHQWVKVDDAVKDIIQHEMWKEVSEHVREIAASYDRLFTIGKFRELLQKELNHQAQIKVNEQYASTKSKAKAKEKNHTVEVQRYFAKLYDLLLESDYDNLVYSRDAAFMFADDKQFKEEKMGMDLVADLAQEIRESSGVPNGENPIVYFLLWGQMVNKLDFTDLGILHEEKNHIRSSRYDGKTYYALRSLWPLKFLPNLRELNLANVYFVDETGTDITNEAMRAQLPFLCKMKKLRVLVLPRGMKKNARFSLLNGETKDDFKEKLSCLHDLYDLRVGWKKHNYLLDEK